MHLFQYFKMQLTIRHIGTELRVIRVHSIIISEILKPLSIK